MIAYQTLATPLVIAGETGKIIRVRRIFQGCSGAVIGTKVILVTSDGGTVFPSFGAGVAAPVVVDFGVEKLQSRSGYDLTFTISGGEAYICLWVDYEVVAG